MLSLTWHLDLHWSWLYSEKGTRILLFIWNKYGICYVTNNNRVFLLFLKFCLLLLCLNLHDRKKKMSKAPLPWQNLDSKIRFWGDLVSHNVWFSPISTKSTFNIFNGGIKRNSIFLVSHKKWIEGPRITPGKLKGNSWRNTHMPGQIQKRKIGNAIVGIYETTFEAGLWLYILRQIFKM